MGGLKRPESLGFRVIRCPFRVELVGGVVALNHHARLLILAG
jgi:hypothetical protein